MFKKLLAWARWLWVDESGTMATTIQTIDAAGQTIYVSFNVTASGNYTTGVGGDQLNFVTATQDPAFIGLVAQVISSQLLQFDIWSQGGNLTRQYVANKVSSSPATGAKVKVGATSTFASELGTGAYPGDVTADLITGFAIFSKIL